MARKMIVRKANELITARYNLNLEEQRLMLFLASQINPQDTDFREYEITVGDFCKVMRLDPSNLYQRFKEMSDTLLQKRIDLIEPNREVYLCWLAQTSYISDNGKVTLIFPSALKPYLLELKKNFTYYAFSNIIGLQSVYSIRIFELLKQYEKLGARTFSVNNLKSLLCADTKYPLYADFKKRVILVAQRELQDKCDIYFELEEKKDGRRVDKLVFHIFQNTKRCPIDTECTETSITALLEDKQSKKTVKPKKSADTNDIQEIIQKLSFIEEDIPAAALMAIYFDAHEDIELIHRRYKVMKVSGAHDVVGWLRAAVRQPDAKFKKISCDPHPSQTSKKNKFINFTQRKNDYTELERLENEQFKQHIAKLSNDEEAK